MAKTNRRTKQFGRLARQLARHHFPGKKFVIKELGGGLTNHVFEAQSGKWSVVIRIAEEREKINYFFKEQWAVSRAREKGIPVPNILEVGNDVIPFPFMISEKLKGTIATHHPARLEILEQLGKMASLIHQVRTEGYGHHFNWSHNELSKKSTWPDFLNNELASGERLRYLTTGKLLNRSAVSKLRKTLEMAGKWKSRPCLQHGDLRLKNIMVDEKGKVLALIDWEESISSIGPYWDLSIALHDLSPDAQQRFLQGYGLKGREITRLSPFLKLFNLLNYVPVMEQLCGARRRNAVIIEYYKARLQGALDLFTP